MNKKQKLEAELKRQIRDKEISRWVSVGFIVLGILLTISIVFAIIGIPMLLIAIFTGYRAEAKAKELKLKLLEV